MDLVGGEKLRRRLFKIGLYVGLFRSQDFPVKRLLRAVLVGCYRVGLQRLFERRLKVCFELLEQAVDARALLDDLHALQKFELFV